MSAIDDIRDERTRQINSEGWSTAHDDSHRRGEMARAAACYAISAGVGSILPMQADKAIRSIWPWLWTWWKPHTRRRDLVKAGALIVAEIERLDRADGIVASTDAGEGADALVLVALKSARDFIANYREDFIITCTLPNDEGSGRDMATMDDLDRKGLADYDTILAALDKALVGAERASGGAG